MLVKWHVDMPGGYTSEVAWRSNVIDQDTDKKVGFVDAERAAIHSESPAKRHVSLFGGKYQGDFVKREECDAFVKGVEAVLSHMVAGDEGQLESSDKAA